MQTTAPDHSPQHAPDALSQAPAGPGKLPGIQHIIAVGSDVDPRSHILCGSILLDHMTIAGDA